MPGQYRLSVDELVKECEGLYSVGVLSVMLFGIPEHKDHTGSDAYSHNGIVQQGIRALKAALPDLIVIADICMCEYTDHGHCGILHDHYTVDNDATLRYDGRPYRRHASGPRRSWLRAAPHHVVRCKVQLRLLWPLP